MLIPISFAMYTVTNRRVLNDSLSDVVHVARAVRGDSLGDVDHVVRAVLGDLDLVVRDVLDDSMGGMAPVSRVVDLDLSDSVYR